MTDSLRDDVLPIIDDGRSLIDDLGFRTSRVIVRKREWTGGKVQSGDAVVTDLELTPRPHVAGPHDDASVDVGPVTPAYSGGGYTAAQLNPPPAIGIDWQYVVIGPDGTERPYRLAKLMLTGALGYMLHLEALDHEPAAIG